MSNVNKITEAINGETDGRASRWHAHRTARHEELLKLARKAVHKLGPQASMEDIASLAKTSKPVYYRYFGDKEGLRQALSANVINDFRERVIAAALAKDQELSSMHAMVTAYLELAANSPNLYYFVTSAPRSADDMSAGALNDFFDEASGMISDRLLKLYDQKATAAALSYWPRAALGMVRAAGEQWLREPDSDSKPSIETMARELTNWLAYGIASTSGTKNP